MTESGFLTAGGRPPPGELCLQPQWQFDMSISISEPHVPSPCLRGHWRLRLSVVLTLQLNSCCGHSGALSGLEMWLKNHYNVFLHGKILWNVMRFRFSYKCLKIYNEKCIVEGQQPLNLQIVVMQRKFCLSGPETFPLTVFILTQSVFSISHHYFIQYSIWIVFVFGFPIQIGPHKVYGPRIHISDFKVI